jgi:hypothetical protein
MDWSFPPPETDSGQSAHQIGWSSLPARNRNRSPSRAQITLPNADIIASCHYAAPISSWIDVRDPVMRPGSAMLHNMTSPAPKVGANLDNRVATRAFRSGLPAPQLTLDPSQREQQVNLIVRDRLSLDLCENDLKVGSDMLPCIRVEPRTRDLLIRISLCTHWAPCCMCPAASTASQIAFYLIIFEHD